MRPRMILAIARKDTLELWLNKATLGGLLFPIILSLLWLFIGKMLGRATTDILIYNPGNSNVSQVVVAAFSNADVIQAGSADEVSAAFSSNDARATTRYAIGLTIPADFDKQLGAGERPPLQLYLDGKTVNVQTQTLIQVAIVDYCRAIASPQPPVEITTTVVNPSPQKNAGAELSKVYAPLALLVSLFIGTTFVPQLLIEEKEKKTLRMLMVTPASFGDVLFGKLLVVLVYQLVLTAVVLAIQGAFTGQVALVILYAVLGGLFSVALGLLFGSLFNTVSAATAVEGLAMIVYVLAGLFVGPLGEVLSSSPVAKIARLLPTYYIADGASNASQSLGTLGSNLLDIGVTLGSTVLLLTVSAWLLRRQSAIAGTI